MACSLFYSLCNENLLFSAWKKVKAKQSAGGVDRITVETFGQNIDKEIKILASELKTGKWVPEPYLKKEIPKKTKEMRTLGLLSVRDKVVQQAIKMLIEPKFENVFFENSYGYRPDKGHTKAVRRALHECQKQDNHFILRLDIDNYFDTVNHEILFQRLRQVIKDEEIVRLVELCTKMGMVTNKNKWKDVTCGVPQGAVLSPLLANLYMNSFDQFVLSKTSSYVRYADDFIILCKDEALANEILVRATVYLSEKLLLKLNPPCVKLIEEGFEFLGIFINPQGLGLTAKKRKDLEDRIAEVDIKNGTFVKKGIEGLIGINHTPGASIGVTQGKMTVRQQGKVVHKQNFIKILLADDNVGFENRERQGASDLVNSMLNYGYAFLYSRIWEAVLGAGLNPYESVIHVRQDGKPTFVYDMVEVFRPQAVDRVVFSLVQKRTDLKMDGVMLSNSTKELLVKSVLDRFQRYEKYRGVEMRLEQIFIEQSREVAAFIDKCVKYKPYLAKW